MFDKVLSYNAPSTYIGKDNYLSGTAIHLVFDYEPKYEEVLPLYIYSDYANFRIDIVYRGKDSEIKEVAQI